MSAKEAKEYGLIDAVISNPLKALRPLPEPVPAWVTASILLIESSFWAQDLCQNTRIRIVMGHMQFWIWQDVNTPTKPYKIKLNPLNHRGFLCPLQLYDVFVFCSFIFRRPNRSCKFCLLVDNFVRFWSIESLLSMCLNFCCLVVLVCPDFATLACNIASDLIMKGSETLLASIASVPKQVNCECCGSIPCMYESRFKVLCLNPAFPLPFSMVNIFWFIN